MSKSTSRYWNPLRLENSENWTEIDGSGGYLQQITLAIDDKSGDYTRLTRFKPGADTAAFGVQCHNYPEEIFIVKGRLYDAAFATWLEQGDYASRPPGEPHGPFRTDVECIVLEISYPSQRQQVGGDA